MNMGFSEYTTNSLTFQIHLANFARNAIHKMCIYLLLDRFFYSSIQPSVGEYSGIFVIDSGKCNYVNWVEHFLSV